MKAIILAAGIGRRLGLAVPKCMAEIGGKSIIHRQLDAFQAVGITDYVVVSGFEQDRLRRHLADYPGRITCITNDRFAETNTLYSLYLARDQMAGGFFYANADVIFDRRLVERLLAPATQTTLAIRLGPCGQEDVKVTLDKGRVIRIGKELDPANTTSECLGVAQFGIDLIANFVQTLTMQVEREERTGEYFEFAVDRLCAGGQVFAVDVSDLPCGEVDFPADLVIARNELVHRLI